MRRITWSAYVLKTTTPGAHLLNVYDIPLYALLTERFKIVIQFQIFPEGFSLNTFSGEVSEFILHSFY